LDRLKALFYLNLAFLSYAFYKLLVTSLYLLNFQETLDYLSAAIYFIHHGRFYQDFNSFYKLHVESIRSKLFGNPYSFILLALLFAFIILSLFIARKFWKMYKKPIDVLLKGIDYEEEKELEKRIMVLAKKFGVNPPRCFVTSSNKVNVLSAAMDKKENFIIFSKSVLNSLEKEEIDSVILHELWHIKNDIKEVTRSSLAFGDFTLMLLFSSSPLIAFLYLFNPDLGLHVVDFFVFSILYSISYYLLLFTDVATISSYYPEYREYDADLASSLITRDASLLISALKKMILLKFVESKFLALQFFAQNKNLEIKSWKEVLKTKLAYPWIKYQHPSPFLRIKFLKLIDRLINEKVSLEIKKPLKKFSAFNISLNPFFLFSPFGKRLRRMKKEDIKAVYDYIALNSNNFNAKDCSIALKIQEEDVISFFISLLRKGTIDVISPAV
jgi:Zn-dependent protease with chaperone function